ncbi:hypothetical protein PFISCL1PPCAC_25127, partial [Pristionchus fissidentatus]
NIIFASYGIPCFAAYILTVISTLSIRKHLTPSFVTIFVLTAFVNCLTYINTWLALRLHQEPLFNFYYHFINWTVVIPIVHQFLIGFFFFAQNINSCLLTIDRFVSIVALNWIDV